MGGGWWGKVVGVIDASRTLFARSLGLALRTLAVRCPCLTPAITTIRHEDHISNLIAYIFSFYCFHIYIYPPPHTLKRHDSTRRRLEDASNDGWIPFVYYYSRLLHAYNAILVRDCVVQLHRVCGWRVHRLVSWGWSCLDAGLVH